MKGGWNGDMSAAPNDGRPIWCWGTLAGHWADTGFWAYRDNGDDEWKASGPMECRPACWFDPNLDSED